MSVQESSLILKMSSDVGTIGDHHKEQGNYFILLSMSNFQIK